MADETEKILLQIDLDVDQINASLVEVKTNIASTKDTLKDLNTQLKAAFAEGNTAKVQQLTEQIVLNESALRGLTSTQKNLQKQLDLNTKANEAQKDSYEQLLRQYELASIQLKTLEGTLKRNTDGTFILTDAYRTQAKVVGDAKEAIDNFNIGINDGRTSVGQYSKALDPLKQEMAGLRTETATLARSMQAANLIQQGAGKIFGENSGITNTLKAAVEGLVIIENLHNIKTGISLSLTSASILQNKLLAGSAVTTGSAITLWGRAQQFLTGSIISTAGALAILQKALIATGIGAVIVSIGLAVSEFLKYQEAVKDAADANDEFTKSLREQQAATKQIKENFLGAGSAFEQLNKQNERNIDLAKARGDSITAIHNLEIKAIDDELAALQKAQTVGAQLSGEDLARRADLVNKKAVLDAEYYTNLEELRKKDEEKYGQFLKKEFDAFAVTQQLIKEALAAVDPAAQLEETVNAAVKLNEKHANEVIAINNEISDQEKLTLENRLKFQLDFFNAQQTLEDARVQFIEAGAGAIVHAFGLQSQAAKALFAVEKAAAVVDIIIKVRQEIGRIAAAYAFLPGGQLISGPLIAAAQIRAALSIGTIIAQSIPNFIAPKAERGIQMGIFGGKPHSSGGTKGYFEDGTAIEVEKDELFTVVNKKSTALLGKLSWLNELGGGISFMKRGGVIKMQDGGFASRTATAPAIGQSLESITDAIANMNIFVRVTDINSVQGKVAKIEGRANI